MGTRMQLMKKKEQTVQHTNSKLREQILLTYSVQKCSEQNKTVLCHNIDVQHTTSTTTMLLQFKKCHILYMLSNNSVYSLNHP